MKNYVSGLFAKLGMERRAQAAAYAARVFPGQGACAIMVEMAPASERLGGGTGSSQGAARGGPEG